jgi:Zn-dependent protease/CBS domain-containing protein
VSTFPFVRLFGFEIRIHVSWAIILAAIVVTVTAQVERMAPTSEAWLRWTIGGVVGLSFLVSALAHELGHALAARRAGIEGGAVVVYVFGSAAGPILETSRPRDEILTAVAGPIVSVLIGVAFLGLAVAGAAIDTDAAVVLGQIALVIGVLNLLLGGANLLPAYPLDGGRVVRAIVWARTGDATRGLTVAAKVGRGVGIGLAVVGTVLIFLMDSVDGLMLALCGWFLVSSSRGIVRHVEVDAMLGDLAVGDVMLHDVVSVPAGLTVDTFGDQLLDGPAQSVPVTDASALVGILGARQLRRVRRDRWATTRARDLMRSVEGLPRIEPTTTLRAALDHLHRTGLDGLPVTEDGVLTGIVTRRAVAEAIRDRVIAAGGRA